MFVSNLPCLSQVLSFKDISHVFGYDDPQNIIYKANEFYTNILILIKYGCIQRDFTQKCILASSE